jgi:hypothetical protein
LVHRTNEKNSKQEILAQRKGFAGSALLAQTITRPRLILTVSVQEWNPAE